MKVEDLGLLAAIRMNLTCPICEPLKRADLIIPYKKDKTQSLNEILVTVITSRIF